MRILADTNVTLRLTQEHDPNQPTIRSAIDVLRTQSADLCIVPQVLYEYWVVATRPIASNGLGMGHAETKSAIDLLLGDFTLLRDERGIFNHWYDTVSTFGVVGRNAHDARPVAAMFRHGLTHLLTLNVSDFTRYAGITAVSPEAVVRGDVPLS